jgi:tetratricopeptide (TPR) repeat protein
LTRFFSQKWLSPPKESATWQYLSPSKKKRLAEELLGKGTVFLFQKKLRALSFLESATDLDPENPHLWIGKARALFEYGAETEQVKFLFAACRYFKIAIEINKNLLIAWLEWGDTLSLLGRLQESVHFISEAREKYQQAIELSTEEPAPVLADLYWGYALSWLETYFYSGEAVDLNVALDAFHTASSYSSCLEPEFLHSYATACLEMALLTNQTASYLKAADLWDKAILQRSGYVEGLLGLAEGLSQLYLHTLDESFAKKAYVCFQKVSTLEPSRVELWLSWAQLLGEHGKVNRSIPLLKEAIELCSRAYALDNKHPLTLAQDIEIRSYLGFLSDRFDLLQEAHLKVQLALQEVPDDLSLWLAQGVVFLHRALYHEDPQFFEEAISSVQNALSIDRTDDESWHLLAKIHQEYAFFSQDETLFRRADKFYNKAKNLKPACPRLAADIAHLNLLRFEHDENLLYLEASLQKWDSILIHYPNASAPRAEWLALYAQAVEWQGDIIEDPLYFERALMLYDQALSINPHLSNIHLRKAGCLVSLGNLTYALVHYQKALYLYHLAALQQPDDEVIWLDWGFCYIHLAHYSLHLPEMESLYLEAKGKICRAGSLGHPQAYYALACLYSLLESPSKAIFFLQKAHQAQALPPIEDLLEDPWLENVVDTSLFSTFIASLPPPKS